MRILLLLLFFPLVVRSQPVYDDFKDTQYFLKSGDQPEQIINSNLFIKATLSKTSCYINEPIKIDYKLYTRLRSQSSVLKQPAFTGGSITELTPKEPVSFTELVNGKVFKVYLIRSVQFIPLQTGSIELGNVSVQNKVGLMKPGLNNPYDGEVIERIVTLQNQPISIAVKPLPSSSIKASSGVAIGQFSINTYTDTNTLSKGDVGNFYISIKGIGNIKSIAEPIINWPTEYQTFDSKTNEQINTTVFPQEGEKIFTIPFLCNKIGYQSLPKVSFTYFDIKYNAYKTISSEPLHLNITNADPAITKVNQPKVDLTNKRYLWIVFGIAALVLLSWLWNEKFKKRKTVVTETQVEESETVEIPLTDYRLLITQMIKQKDNAFIDALAIHFKQYLYQRFSIGQDVIISNTALLKVLHQKGIDENIVQEIKSILDEMNLAAYTPASSADATFILKDRVLAVMDKIEAV